MLAGRTNPALAGSGGGCGLAGRTRPVSTQSGAASWPSPHMSKSHSFFGPPPFRVPLTYARSRVGSTDFVECDRYIPLRAHRLILPGSIMCFSQASALRACSMDRAMG